MKTFVILLLLALPMAALAYHDDIDISDIELKPSSNDAIEVSGVVQNTSGNTLKNIMVTYAAYSEGVKIQESRALTPMLRPNERWQFSALLVNGFYRYELESVTYQQAEK